MHASLPSSPLFGLPSPLASLMRPEPSLILLLLLLLTACAGPATRAPDEPTGDDDDAVDDDDAADDDDATPLPYPPHDPYLLKGIQPDFWPDYDEVAGSHTGRVSMNLVWAFWEPSPQSAPCAPGQQEYDGRCFVVDTAVDMAINEWTVVSMDLGLDPSL